MSYKTIFTDSELKQGSEAWLENRLNVLGGSEVACLMGASPWKTPSDLWEIKCRFKKDETVHTEAMERGNRLEPVARDWYAAHFRHPLEPLCLKHPTIPFLWSSLDGISKNRRPGENLWIVEIKCPTTAANHRKHTEGYQVPDFRYPQIQHQLAVTSAVFGTDKVQACDYVSFWIDDKDPAAKPIPVVIRVKPDWAYIALLIEREAKFMDMVQRRIRPTQADFPPIYRGEDGKLTAGVLAQAAAFSSKPEVVNSLPTGGFHVYGNSGDSYKRKPKAKTTSPTLVCSYA